MYGWGGSTTGWRGSGSYSFDPARKKHLDRLAAAGAGSRSYSVNRTPNMALVDPRGKEISSDSENPVIVAIDVTGSMASWPGEIFDRLPLLYQTLSQYRSDAEFSFAAIGDATCDSYPLQVNDFASGVDLEDHVKALGCEGRGGGQIMETYELFAYDMLHHCSVPKATTPFLLIFGDEKPYSAVDPGQVEHYIGDKIQAPLDGKKVWEGLAQKFNVYFLQKPYGSGSNEHITKEVRDTWAGLLGEEKVIPLPELDYTESGEINFRAVDIAMGLVAKHWGHYGDFSKNLDARHDDPSVKKSVHTSLMFLPDATATSSSMKTVVDGPSRSLLDLAD